MSLLALSLGLVAFIAVLRLLRARETATGIVATAQDSIVVMSDPDLPDEEKEARIRNSSLRLFGSFFVIAGIGIAATLAAALIVWGGAQASLYSLDQALALAASWSFLLGSTVAAIALWLALDRLRGPRIRDTHEQPDEVPYGAMDKALHNYAFASPARQRTLAGIENRLYRSRIDIDRAARPVFITSLPRAGTTMMLNLLTGLPEFASATYRHMPFTLSPLLWGGFSGAFRKSGGVSERAHGDGIEVGVDSPEAFEEMIWTAFWPDHYDRTRIRPWRAEDRDPDFERFLRTHMAKIVATKPEAARYVSKNNANIARLDLLDAIFPDATFIIPVRDPRAQVASLLRQHARFSDLHAREPFARQYMEGLGHFEFGDALRPIDFDGTDRDPREAASPDFWLGYWIAAYESVLARAGRGAVFVDHDALSADPDAHLPLLARAIGTDDPDGLRGLGDMFRAPHAAPALPEADPALLRRALDLHSALRSRALAPAGDARLAASA